MYLQDERFVAMDEYRDPIVWSRLGISEEDIGGGVHLTPLQDAEQ
jgi:hypothetical protein